jgi:paxillin
MRTSQLDSMLGSLQSDMTRQGVSTVKKGTCAACNKPIIGQVCTALGKTWHPEHFTCVACELPLGSRNFFEREGKPFCEKDYHELYAPRCAYCNGPILDVSVIVAHCIFIYVKTCFSINYYTANLYLYKQNNKTFLL